MPSKDKERNRAYQAKWYKKNREVHYARIKKRELETRKKLKEYKNKLVCSCGENHPSCIDFHHLDPKEKEINISQTGNRGWSWKRIEKEIKKCIPLCANCHKKLHWNENNENNKNNENNEK